MSFLNYTELLCKKSRDRAVFIYFFAAADILYTYEHDLSVFEAIENSIFCRDLWFSNMFVFPETFLCKFKLLSFFFVALELFCPLFSLPLFPINHHIIEFFRFHCETLESSRTYLGVSPTHQKHRNIFLYFNARKTIN